MGPNLRRVNPIGRCYDFEYYRCKKRMILGWRHPSYLRGPSVFRAKQVGANSGNFKPIGHFYDFEPYKENSGRACEGAMRRTRRPYFAPSKWARIPEALNRSAAFMILSPMAVNSGGAWGKSIRRIYRDHTTCTPGRPAHIRETLSRSVAVRIPNAIPLSSGRDWGRYPSYFCGPSAFYAN